MSTIVLITIGKGFAILLALKSTPSASQHRLLGDHYARRFLIAPINTLFVKTSTDYIITTLTDSTLVNFSQSTFCLYENLFLCLMVLSFGNPPKKWCMVPRKVILEHSIDTRKGSVIAPEIKKVGANLLFTLAYLEFFGIIFATIKLMVIMMPKST